MNRSKILAAYTLLNERKWSNIPSKPTIRRAAAKIGRLTCRLMRNKSSDSMMTANHPKGFNHLPKYMDERTKMLFNNHANRLKDKADRK